MSNVRIGQLARAAGFTEKTLRLYDEIGVLRPSGRSASGYRLYDEQAVERLRFVRKAQGRQLWAPPPAPSRQFRSPDR